MAFCRYCGVSGFPFRIEISQRVVGVDTGVVAVRPGDANSVASHIDKITRCRRGRGRLPLEQFQLSFLYFIPGALIPARGAGTILAQVCQRIAALAAAFPGNDQFAPATIQFDLCRTFLFVVHRQIDGCYGENQLYVLGTKGNGSLTRHSQISDLSDERVWKYDGSVNSMYQAEHDALFASIRSGNPINHGERMANSTMTRAYGAAPA